MPKREMKLLLQDIIENTEMIFQFVGADSYQEFVDDKMKVYAVISESLPYNYKMLKQIKL